MKLIIIDNYDSFTYNLVQLIENILQTEIIVKKNDEFDIEKIASFDKIVISPGPGIPIEAGNIIELIKRYSPTIPILGVCLGNQAIAEAFGGKLKNLSNCYHGIASQISILQEDPLFKDIPNLFLAGRYHSWIIDSEAFPHQELEIIAVDENKQIMACKHKKHPTYGVQFHPESILTPEGKQLIQNWLLL